MRKVCRRKEGREGRKNTPGESSDGTVVLSRVDVHMRGTTPHVVRSGTTVSAL